MSRIERAVVLVGTGTIVAGIAEDSKAIAIGGGIVLVSWLGLKVKGKGSRNTKQMYETPDQTDSGSEIFGTKTTDIHIASQPARAVIYEKAGNDNNGNDGDENSDDWDWELW